MKKDSIAIVGAGKGGTAILETLLKMPDVALRRICDRDPEAPGLKLARERGIPFCLDLETLCRDSEVDLVFEATGDPSVAGSILKMKQPRTRIIVSEDAKIIWHLLDLQQSANRGLERRVGERTAELREKVVEFERLNEKLQQVNNEKTRYLLHATHQLKAPFAAIQSYTDLLLDGYAGALEPKTRDIVHKIQERCILLSDSIKEMLELANLKSLVRENVRMEEASIEGIVSSVVRHFADLAASKGVRFSVPPISGARARCNRNQILILLSTLVENAVHYSPAGAEILVSAEGPDASGKVRISVRDQGIGIDPRLHGRIFDEYFRANEAVAAHEQGTGLGLAIAKEIAGIHGTAIEVESSPGKGSTFSFHLRSEP
jgi:signal transduction histidine kinase